MAAGGSLCQPRVLTRDPNLFRAAVLDIASKELKVEAGYGVINHDSSAAVRCHLPVSQSAGLTC